MTALPALIPALLIALVLVTLAGFIAQKAKGK